LYAVEVDRAEGVVLGAGNADHVLDLGPGNAFTMAGCADCEEVLGDSPCEVHGAEVVVADIVTSHGVVSVDELLECELVKYAVYSPVVGDLVVAAYWACKVNVVESEPSAGPCCACRAEMLDLESNGVASAGSTVCGTCGQDIVERGRCEDVVGYVEGEDYALEGGDTSGRGGGNSEVTGDVAGDSSAVDLGCAVYNAEVMGSCDVGYGHVGDAESDFEVVNSGAVHPCVVFGLLCYERADEAACEVIEDEAADRNGRVYDFFVILGGIFGVDCELTCGDNEVGEGVAECAGEVYAGDGVLYEAGVVGKDYYAARRAETSGDRDVESTGSNTVSFCVNGGNAKDCRD
jgi:hypothetical protein